MYVGVPKVCERILESQINATDDALFQQVVSNSRRLLQQYLSE